MKDIFQGANSVFGYLGDGLDRSLRSYRKDPNALGSLEPLRFHGKDDENERDLDLSEFRSLNGPMTLSAVSRYKCFIQVFCVFSHLARMEHLTSEFMNPQDGSECQEAETRYLFESLRQFMRSRWWNRIWIGR